MLIAKNARGEGGVAMHAIVDSNINDVVTGSGFGVMNYNA
jgi:hypothetical protein